MERGERASCSARIWSVGSQTAALCSTENTTHPLLLVTWSAAQEDGGPVALTLCAEIHPSVPCMPLSPLRSSGSVPLVICQAAP